MTDSEFLTLPEVAKYLGVSKSTLIRMHESGDGPPSVQLGKRLRRYRRSELEAWVAQKRAGSAHVQTDSPDTP